MRPILRELDPIATAKLKEAIRDFHGRLTFLTDWRVAKPVYPISYLIGAIVVSLVLGDNDIATVESTLTKYGPLVASWLGVAYVGCPSDSTLLRTLWNASSTELLIAVSEWSMKWFGRSDVFAIDGKAVRAALEKVCGKTHSPYILNAFSSDHGYISAQLKIGEKKNELSVVCDLFDMLPVEGSLFTMDAFATHVKVLRELLRRNGNALIPIKDNQEGLHNLVAEFFCETVDKSPKNITWYEDEDNGERKHGRVEARVTGLITKGVAELVKGTRFEGLINGIAVISRERTILRHGSVEDLKSDQVLVYLFTDPDMTAEKAARAARGHWSGCEVIHYILDTEFDEDHSTVRTGNGMENLSCLRKMAYSILCWIRKQAKESGKKGFGSLHLIRFMLRDLHGIPKLTDSEYRKLVNELRKAEKLKSRKRTKATRSAPA